MLTVEYRYVPSYYKSQGHSCWGVTNLTTGEFYPFGEDRKCADGIVKDYTSDTIHYFSCVELGLPPDAKHVVPEEPEEVVLPVKHGRKFKNIFL